MHAISLFGGVPAPNRVTLPEVSRPLRAVPGPAKDLAPAPTPAEAVEQHRRLVRRIAKRVWQRWFQRFPLEDLVAYGMIGLLESIPKFDPSRGVKFMTYARWWVLAAIKRGVYAMNRLGEWTTRRLRKEGLALTFVQEKFAELQPIEEADLVDRLDSLRLTQTVRVALKTLPPRWAKIILLYHCEELTFHAIGARYGISRQAVYQNYRKGMRKLREALGVEHSPTTFSLHH